MHVMHATHAMHAMHVIHVMHVVHERAVGLQRPRADVPRSVVSRALLVAQERANGAEDAHQVEPVAVELGERLVRTRGTPHVDIASAVCASACIPGLIQPVWLLENAADGTTRPYPPARAHGARALPQVQTPCRQG